MKARRAQARLCGRGRPNAVPNPLDSRFRGNDGVEIGNGGAIIILFSLMSARPSAGAFAKFLAAWEKRPPNPTQTVLC